MKDYVVPAEFMCHDCGTGATKYICTKCHLEMCRGCAEEHDCEEVR